MKGRKRHTLVDTLGLLLIVVVHAANIQESDGAKLVLRRAAGRFPRLRLIWADQGYKDHFVAWAKAATGWIVEVVAKPKEQRGSRCCRGAGWSSGRSLGSGGAGG